MRWLEWGVNSFFYSLVGLMVGLFGLAIVIRTVMPRWLGWSAVLCGLGLIINAVPVGFRGFAATPAGMVAVLLLVLTAVGIAVTGLRRTRTARLNSPRADQGDQTTRLLGHAAPAVE